MEKYSTVGQATNGTMMHAYYMLEIKGFKQTLRLCTSIIAFPLQQLLYECASTLRYSTSSVLFCSG